MQMRAEAAEGGDHLLASSWAVYNELAATRPDIIRTLATPNWYFDPCVSPFFALSPSGFWKHWRSRLMSDKPAAESTMIRDRVLSSSMRESLFQQLATAN